MVVAKDEEDRVEGAAKATRKAFKVGELARRTGMTRQAIHTYVQMGLLEVVAATRGGQRLFGEEAEERIQLIRKLCASGYTLKDIREIFIRGH